MAFERNNTAGDFETMLRRHLEQTNRLAGPCSEFDAEVASAYLEGSLGASARLRYESHLAGCGTCRHGLVTLHRLSSAAVMPAIASQHPLMDWWQSLKDGLSMPGWRSVVVATASIFVVLLGVYAVRRQSASSAPSATIARMEQAPETRQALATAATGTSALPTPRSSSNVLLRVESRQEQLARARIRPDRDDAGASAPPSQAPQLSADVRTVTAEEPDVKLGLGPAPGKQMIASVQQPAKSGDVETRKEESAGGRQDAPRPPETVAAAATMSERPLPAAGARRLAPREATPAKPKATPTPRSNEDENFHALVRRVRDKTFRFDRGVWIDQEYKPENRLQRTRLNHGSSDYERVLTEIPALAPFFDLGPVIVIWQGRVYDVRK